MHEHSTHEAAAPAPAVRDVSGLVAFVRDVELAYAFVLLTPLLAYILFAGPLREDTLPASDALSVALIGVYGGIAAAAWVGWRRGKLDRLVAAALAAHLVASAAWLVVAWRAGERLLAIDAGVLLGGLLLLLAVAGARGLALARSAEAWPLRPTARALFGPRLFGRRPPRRQLARHSVLRYAEFVLSLAAFGWWWLVVSDHLDRIGNRLNDQALALIQYGLTVPLLLHAIRCKRTAEQWRALSIEEAEPVDDRAPILFLRSFGDDALHVHADTLLAKPLPLECPALDHRYWGRLARLEEVLATSLWHLGPVVALGAPGEALPPLGALRSYYSDDLWQARVRRLMRSARLILVIPSAATWVQWEIDTALQLGLGPRLVFLLPAGTATAQAARWELLAAALDRHGTGALPRACDPRARAVLLQGSAALVLRCRDLEELDLFLLVRAAALLAGT